MKSRFLMGALSALVILTATSAIAAPGSRNAQPAQQGSYPVNPFTNFLAIFSAVPRQVVPFQSNQPAGTIVVRTSERRLYLVMGDGQAHAIRHRRRPRRDSPGPALRPSRRKAEWPDWTPPARDARAGPTCRATWSGGPENPLGARAMYLGASHLPHPRLERAGDDRHRRSRRAASA